jgi:hypothetical protein
MPEPIILEGPREEIFAGVAGVAAGLNHGRPGFEESDIRRQIEERGHYLGQPIMPGPELLLTPQGDDIYTLQLINGRGANQTGNVDRAQELVERHLAQYFAD